MKKISIYIVFSIVIILFIQLILFTYNLDSDRLVADTTNTNTQINIAEIKNSSNITLILNYNDGENVTYFGIALQDDITAFNATIEAIGLENISYYTAINGVFVEGMRINGTWYMNGNGGRNWLFYVNDQFPGVSSSVLELENNSVVEWKFVVGDPYGGDDKPPNDFWIYIGIFIGIAAGCGVVIFYIARKGV